MKRYPNYRVAVEIILIDDDNSNVLLTKRSDDCIVAPGRWCVPAGKVKYEEIPVDACLREAKEEICLDVDIVKEIGVRAFKGYDSKGDITYRLVYTYLVKSKEKKKNPVIDDEHSEFRWVSREELNDKTFNSMNPSLKELIKKVFE